MLPRRGTTCGDITDTLFGNKVVTTRQAPGYGDLEEQPLEASGVLSQAGFTHLFRLSV